MADPQPELTDQIRHDLLIALRGALPLDVAARSVGVHDGTVQNWRAKDPEFDREVIEAQALAESLLISRVNAGKANWRSAAWLLERLFPERYAPKEPTDIPDAPAPVLDDQQGL